MDIIAQAIRDVGSSIAVAIILAGILNGVLRSK